MRNSKTMMALIALSAITMATGFVRLTGLAGTNRVAAAECGAADVTIPGGLFRVARGRAFGALNAAAEAQDEVAYRNAACVLAALARHEIARNPINADGWMTLADAVARRNRIDRLPPLDDEVKKAFAHARAFGRLEYPIISRRVEFLAFYSGEGPSYGQLLDEEVNLFLQYTSPGQAMNYLCYMVMEMDEAETARVRGAVERMRPDALPTFDNVLWRMREGTFPHMPRG